MGGNWTVGVILSVCGAFAGASGKVYMKHYHNTKMRRHFRLALFFSVLLDPALTMASALFAPQSIIAPIVALDIVWNTVLASYFLKERVTTRDYITVFMLMGGCALATAGGPRETPDYSREELKGFFSGESFIIYMAILGLWLAVLYMVAFGMNRFFTGPEDHHDVRGASHPLLVKAHRFSFGALAGTISGNLYFLKASMESLKEQGTAVFSHYEFHIFIVGAMVTLFLGLYHLNQGLRLYDAVTVGCTTEVWLIVNGSISGLIIFREFDEISGSPGRLVMYFGGLLVCLIGIFILANRPPPSTTAGSSSSSSSMPRPSFPYSPPPSLSIPHFFFPSSSSSATSRRSSLVAEQGGRGGVEGGSEEGTMTRLSESLVSVHRQEV